MLERISVEFIVPHMGHLEVLLLGMTQYMLTPRFPCIKPPRNPNEVLWKFTAVCFSFSAFSILLTTGRFLNRLGEDICELVLQFLSGLALQFGAGGEFLIKD